MIKNRRFAEHRFQDCKDVDFQVREVKRDRLPRWLHWNNGLTTLLGVPAKKDAGTYQLVITAIGKNGDIAKAQFVVRVILEKYEQLKYKDGKVRAENC